MVDNRNHDGEITSVQALLQLIEKNKLPDRHGHVRIWFRGHADANWELHPGVYRKGFADSGDARLDTERHLFQDFRVESAGLLAECEDEQEIYFLQQHYGMPTRLLDWTRSSLSALHFAVTDKNHESKNGSLFMMDAYQLAPSQGATDKTKADNFRGVMTSRNKVFRKALRAIWMGRQS